MALSVKDRMFRVCDLTPMGIAHPALHCKRKRLLSARKRRKKSPVIGE
jgi:hypothetical protein